MINRMLVSETFKRKTLIRSLKLYAVARYAAVADLRQAEVKLPSKIFVYLQHKWCKHLIYGKNLSKKYLVYFMKILL